MDGEWLAELGAGLPAGPGTLLPIFSASKGAAATVIAHLVDRRVLAYDDPVARYWSEFGAAGKEAITVGEILSHQAGLFGVRESVRIEDFYSHSRVADLLSRQAPLATPEAGVWGYHALTFGVLADELVRRSDGRTLSAYFDQEIASPFGIDLYFELPRSEAFRQADVAAPGWPAGELTTATEAARLAYGNPIIDPLWANTPQWRAAGFPAGGALASARGLASLYAALIADSPTLLSPQALREATAQRVEGNSLTSGRFGRYAAGFSLNANDLFGPSPGSFGHAGIGGSIGFADPDARVAFGYVTSCVTMLSTRANDPRVPRLIQALYEGLDRSDRKPALHATGRPAHNRASAIF
jgi:CubicO group peptidase (beta-lactamase class C family)